MKDEMLKIVQSKHEEAMKNRMIFRTDD